MASFRHYYYFFCMKLVNIKATISNTAIIAPTIITNCLLLFSLPYLVEKSDKEREQISQYVVIISV